MDHAEVNWIFNSCYTKKPPGGNLITANGEKNLWSSPSKYLGDNTKWADSSWNHSWCSSFSFQLSQETVSQSDNQGNIPVMLTLTLMLCDMLSQSRHIRLLTALKKCRYGAACYRENDENKGSLPTDTFFKIIS